DILFEGVLTTSDGINCVAAPVRIRGRVFAAEDMMRKDEAISPRYLPKMMTGLRFGEIEGNVAFNLLPQDARFVEIDTDEDGFFSIQVLPTVYGISIPTAEDYWGDHIDWKNETSGGGLSQGWPYPETWPFGFPISPPKGYAVWPSLPLVLQSGDDYVVDIYLHKQRGLFLLQFEEGDAPSRELLLVSEGNGATTREIALYSDLFTPDSTGEIVDLMSFPLEGGEEINGSFLKKHFVIFENLPSGTQTFTASHPRFTFDVKEYTFPDWPAPGILPTTPPAPLGLNTGQPLHLSSIPNDVLESTYIPSTTTLSIKIKTWNEQSEIYSDPDPVGFENTAFAKLPYANDAIFDSRGRPTPTGPFTFWIEFNGGFWEDTVASEGENKVIELFAGGPSNIAPNSTGPSATFLVFPKALYAADPSVHVPGATFRANGKENPIDGVSKITVTGNLLTLGGITPPDGWLEESEVVTFGGVNGTMVTINVTGTYAKLMTAMVTLKDSTDNTAITEASVRIRSASGGVLTSTSLSTASLTHIGGGVFSVTDFSVSSSLRTQECLVEVEAPGYKPFAKRVIPDTSPTPAELILEVELFRLPLPTITKAELNRYGLFIPGIKLTGNETAFDPPLPPEQDPFSATWKVTGRSANPFQVTLDTVDGDPLATQDHKVTKTITDPVANLYLIDSRAFNGNPSDPKIEIIPSKATDPSRPSSIRGWIRRVEDGTLPNVVYQRVNAPSPENPFEAGDVINLPD
ncbi:MAG: hypothetical protein O7C75_21600, partial [Verrucomicrobia bacterium]|nr:hypothetical protein [Verrucomicrobiota bacterium]